MGFELSSGDSSFVVKDRPKLKIINLKKTSPKITKAKISGSGGDERI